MEHTCSSLRVLYKIHQIIAKILLEIDTFQKGHPISCQPDINDLIVADVLNMSKSLINHYKLIEYKIKGYI